MSIPGVEGRVTNAKDDGGLETKLVMSTTDRVTRDDDHKNNPNNSEPDGWM